MQQNRTIFFAIIGLAVIGVIAIFLTRFLLADELELPVTQPSITLRIVVAPSIRPWVEEAARQFNQANPRSQVELVTAEELIPTTQFTATPPAAWLAEATFLVETAGLDGLQFSDARSVASTSLAWGAFNTKQTEFEQKYGGLTWAALHQAATEPGSALKVVIAVPRNSAEGLAALISAVAADLNTPTLSSAEVTGAEAWLTETLAESARGSLTLGPDPAQAFATRGVSTGDAGLLSMASWRRAGLANRPDFTMTPAEPNVTLDYPFAIWNGNQSTPAQQQGAAAFRDFLLGESQQQTLPNFFLEQAGSTPASVQADGSAVVALQRWAERALR
jgi:hypothetical protein